MRRILVSVLFVLSAGIPHSIATPSERVGTIYALSVLRLPSRLTGCLGEPSAGTTIDLPHCAQTPSHARYGAHLPKEQSPTCPVSAIRTPANHRTDDAPRLHAYTAADSMHPLRWSSRIARGRGSGGPKDVLSRRDVRVTPMFLHVLYGTAKYEPTATGRDVLEVTGFLGKYPSPSDLGSSDGIDASFKAEQVNGGHVGMTRTTPVTRRTSTLKGSIPLTITTSYGDEQTVLEDYAKSTCTLFARLGLRGVSVLFASGDRGVGRGVCMANDDSGKVRFLPIFPASWGG
ncbi:hypothetical protein EDB87DRAFT_1578691 [Lactarius vividus]|nr:hypothetical protein EDB87DRAFT_1578691 [Lactarius vividus]